MNPSSELYGALQDIYEHFNRTLFDKKLPEVIFTTQRQKGVMGYFSPDRWVSRKGKKCHEIAINPAYVGQSALIDVFQTMVHEQCHLYQHANGKPGRRGYHNKEWGRIMEDIGLMPSSTGKPGGKKTGERMSDYPIEGGRFMVECERFVSDQSFCIPWIDRFAKSPATSTNADHAALSVEFSSESSALLVTTVSEILEADDYFEPEEPAARNKSKYTCPSCAANVWGRPDLLLRCMTCEIDLREISEQA